MNCYREDGGQESKAIADQSKLITRYYYLKAMNCPHHHRIFAAEPKSYRDLPLRLAEYGTAIATSRAASCSASCACVRST
jgi:threonyl-tRNA synthetase